MESTPIADSSALLGLGWGALFGGEQATAAASNPATTPLFADYIDMFVLWPCVRPTATSPMMYVCEQAVSAAGEQRARLRAHAHQQLRKLCRLDPDLAQRIHVSPCLYASLRTCTVHNIHISHKCS